MKTDFLFVKREAYAYAYAYAHKVLGIDMSLTAGIRISQKASFL